MKERLFDASNALVASEELYTTEQSTHALYAQAKYNRDKFGVQIGLRGERFNRKAQFITDNTNVDNTFTDYLSISAFEIYNPNDISTFAIGYNRRTFRT